MRVAEAELTVAVLRTRFAVALETFAAAIPAEPEGVKAAPVRASPLCDVNSPRRKPEPAARSLR